MAYYTMTWQHDPIVLLPREGGADLQKRGGASHATPPHHSEMAEEKEECAVVELVNLSTHKKEEAVLTGVGEVDLDSVDAVVRSANHICGLAVLF